MQTDLTFEDSIQKNYPSLKFVFIYFSQSQEQIPISPQDVRLAIIQFGHLMQTDLTFEDSIRENHRTLAERIKKIPKLFGNETNTPKGLDQATAYLRQNPR